MFFQVQLKALFQSRNSFPRLNLKEKKIPFVREMTFHPHYRGHPMESTFRVDFICKDDIIVECKAVKELIDVHRAQIINYLRATYLRLGFLVNFSEYFVVPERIINFNWEPTV